MTKAELEARIEDMFTNLEPGVCRSLPVGGDAAMDGKSSSIILERAWLELSLLVNSLLDT